MKLITAVVHMDDAEPVINALIIAGFDSTHSVSMGSFLGQKNVTIMCAVEDDQLDEAVEIVCSNASSHEHKDIDDPDIPADITSGVLFVTDLIRFENLGE